MSTFAQLLKEERERKGLSQEALGKLVGVSQQTVAQWEAGNALPRAERRQRLDQILGLYGDKKPQSRPHAAFTRATELFREPSATPLAAIHETYKRDQEALREALPAQLHRYLEGMIGVGNMQRRLDYLSPSAAVEIKRVSSARNALNVMAPAILRLAIARQLSEASGQFRHYLLIVLCDEALPLRALNYASFDAGVLGITVENVRTMREAATLLAAVEEAGPDFPDLYDDIGPDEFPSDEHDIN